MTAIPPGSTIGILGSGQLGRMLAVAAAQLGYRCHIYAPESGPACDVAAAFTGGSYHQSDLLAQFAAQCDVVTYEFENVPVDPLELLGDEMPLRPGIRALEVAQDRVSEKQYALANRRPHRAVRDLQPARRAGGGAGRNRAARDHQDHALRL